MGLMDQITTGKQIRPRRTMVYGVHGIGKSTFGAMAENPVFIQTEDGLADIGVAKFPLCQTVGDVKSGIGALYTEKHDYATVVIDSLDWLERLIFAEVCAKRNVKSIEDIGYAKGYTFALTHWREILDGLDALRNERDMQVILIAHAGVQKFDNPETESYSRYEPKLHKTSAALVMEWCDEVFCAIYKVLTKETEEGFGKKRARGIGEGDRVLRTTDRPAHSAKNRMNLPSEIPLDYRAYAALRDAHFAGGVAAPAEAESVAAG